MTSSPGSDKSHIAATRRMARHYAMQALYQWHMAGSSLNAIEAEFRTDNDMSKVDVDYFHELLHGVPEQLSGLEEQFQPFLVDRSLEELDAITRALLRMATYELKNRIDVPYKVVINEAVSLAKKFGAEDSHKFINGVLDKTAEVLRALEVNAERGKR
ncbi:transcription antitermination factor NusB [Cellvibrio japonicus]|nr:transcription antitermination factor NusB [Cellvibrio japonicus]QEI13052.1 transcription antitermination factor NusB [Cellvibrio japonicus]QEI16626.1 transcription antitermination factor NusB [Cellvibrio japonicus]QEI20204.1 transcription antitermination factor NusB [Cellvibrio japonicus]